MDPGAEVSLKKYFGPKLDTLAKSIDDASAASEAHAKALTRATWVLAFATMFLAIATVVLVYVTAAA